MPSGEEGLLALANPESSISVQDDSRYEEKQPEGLCLTRIYQGADGLCRQAMPCLLVHKGWSHTHLLFQMVTPPAGTTGHSSKGSCTSVATDQPFLQI